MTDASPHPFAVMAKPVGSRCNMRCRYCYYLDKGRFSAHPRQTRMNPTMLETFIRQTIAASPGPVVSFTWHGGEPTLAGLDFYQMAVALEKKYLPKGWEAWNNLQTNGLLLNRQWCEFLRENRFDVGLSIDGTQAVHDANRCDPGGGGTYERVRRAALRLHKAGIRPDLLCTVHSATVQDSLGVYRALRAWDSGWIQFIPIVVRLPDGSLSPESVTPEAYGDFLCSVFDEWVSHDLGALDVQLFAETARILAGGSASVCWMAPTCGRVLVVEEDGNVYACDHFVDPEHRLGNLCDDLRALADGSTQSAFGDRKRDGLTAQCRACPHLPLCGGGCPKDRFAQSADGEPGHNYLCEGLRRYFDHAVPVLHRVMDMSRRGLRPEQIMDMLGKGRERSAER